MVHIDFGFPNNNSFKNLNSLLYWLIIFHHQIIFGAVLTIQSPIPPFPRLMNKKKIGLALVGVRNPTTKQKNIWLKINTSISSAVVSVLTKSQRFSSLPVKLIKSICILSKVVKISWQMVLITHIKELLMCVRQLV